MIKCIYLFTVASAVNVYPPDSYVTRMYVTNQAIAKLTVDKLSISVLRRRANGINITGKLFTMYYHQRTVKG